MMIFIGIIGALLAYTCLWLKIENRKCARNARKMRCELHHNETMDFMKHEGTLKR